MPSSVTLAVATGLSPLDARRGLIRVSPQVMQALSLAPWDVAVVTGARPTAALLAKSAPGSDPRIAWCDDLTVANAQARQTITIERAPMRTCRRLVVHGADFVTESVDPELLRSALLGKPVSRHDTLSLLAQDYSLAAGVDRTSRDAERLELARLIGQGWQQMTFTVVECEPALAGVVAPDTQVQWHGSTAQRPGSSRQARQLGVRQPSAATADAWRQAAQTLPVPSPAPSRPADPFHRPVDQPSHTDRVDRAEHSPRAGQAGAGPDLLPPSPFPPSPFSPSPRARPAAAGPPPPAPQETWQPAAPSPPTPAFFPPAGSSRPGQAAPSAPADSLPPSPVPAFSVAPVQAPTPPGLGEPTRLLIEWLDLDFHRRDLLRRLGSDHQLGVLLTAPPGAGCAEVVRAACQAVGARLERVWAPEVLESPDPTQVMADALDAAAATSPGVLLIDDIEALCPAGQPPGQAPLLASTLRLIERAVRDPRVAVVCTSHQPSAVHPQVRAAGRLDRELVISPPDETAREQMLGSFIASMPTSDLDLGDLASRTPGFVRADLQRLVREAALRAAYRAREAAVASVTHADFDAALDVVLPSTAQGRAMPVPDLTLDDVGDMAEAKQALIETVLWPLQHPETFARLGVASPGGVLLHGPPGCGKTFLVRALAGSGRVSVLSVKGAELLSKWVGQSEQGVRDLFHAARASAPALIFLDEVDALAPIRGKGGDSGTTDRVVAALLTELDGMQARNGVVVIGATNRIDQIDPAVLRPGRLERHVYVPRPDRAARAQVLRAVSRRTPLSPDVDLDEVAARTEGFSNADCDALIREAALAAMRESIGSQADVGAVESRHLEAALATVSASRE
ncbi:MAG: AAA family ATPase [Actinomycetales bacterium]